MSYPPERTDGSFRSVMPAGEPLNDGALPATRVDRGPLIVLIPVYEDWPAVRLLLASLDDVLTERGLTASILLVDDGSQTSDEAGPTAYRALRSVDVLSLRRNVGHQRAICIGLSFVEAHLECETIVVMDGDGEDAPSDVPRLLERYEGEQRRKIVFARRAQRSEGMLFAFFYSIYRVAFRFATGDEIRFGNFSVLPVALLRRIVGVSEIWNHYAAGIVRARLPRVELSTARGRRLAGEPKMNFVALVAHGFSAVSVYSDVAGTRLFVASIGFMGAVSLLLPVVVAVRLSTDLAIPGWATSAFGLLLVLLIQGLALSVFFVFIVLHTRQSYSFIPRRDYREFVLDYRASDGSRP